MYLLAAVLAFALAVLALAVGLGVIGDDWRRMQRRLSEVQGPSRSERAAQAGVRFQNRAESAFVRYLTVPTAIAKLERNLVLAGSPDNWPLAKVMTFKAFGTLAGVVLAFIFLTGERSLLGVLGTFLSLFVGYFGPDVVIQRLARTRQETIQRDLPGVLEQVTIALESGLGFEGSLAYIGQRHTGPLSDELVRTVQDLRLGLSRNDAYQALADRTDVPELDRFVRALVQAEQHGISISKAVRSQAKEMRFARRKRAEAKANQVPVKIIFPLMACILPVLFAVILTPALMRIADAF
ncbi:MAG TPA: type II secretion system F family protein [Aeromicrobium sp.]|nr:type II secretion system F family protein [Aeromicrobium sp.]